MPRVLPRVCFLWLGICALATAGVTHLGTHNFTLPDGFEIEWVAGPPEVDHPVSLAFDEQGNLYVTESSGSSAKAPDQATEQPNRVLRFAAAGADGRFTKRTVFADHLAMVEGAMWRDGSLYVGAPPSIWKLTDADGDGVAEKREEWYQGKTVTGCGNDIHGPYAGPEGWIYWCKGAFAEQTHNGQTDRASHIFRCRPDGSGLESIMTGGMDNPVGLAFTREGEPIFSATFLDLSGDGKRDGLAHAVYGGCFGKVNEVMDDRAIKRTGPLLPAMTHYGAGAPCGIIRIEAEVLGQEYCDNLLVCLFNLHKVTRHILEPDGATYKTRDSDFLVSDNLDFHPTDVLEDADGSLLIVDTGGWYKVCCPTSQLAKPDVPGAIYRVRKTGAPKVEDPRGLQLDWPALDAPSLAALLGDPRPAVVARAMSGLAKNGAGALPALQSAARSHYRRNVLWTLAQIPGPAAQAMVRAVFKDRYPIIRETAAKVAALTRDPKALAGLGELLDDDSPQVKRVAVEALGRLREREAVPLLFAVAKDAWATMARASTSSNETAALSIKALPSHIDRYFEHSLAYALLETAQPAATYEGLGPERSAGETRVALVALSELNAAELTPQIALPFLASTDPALQEPAIWIASRHADWAPEFASFLGQQLKFPLMRLSYGNPDADQLAQSREFSRIQIENLFVTVLGDPAIQKVATNLLLNGNHTTRARILGAIGRAGLKRFPAEWVEPCVRLLHDEPELREAVLPIASGLAGRPEGKPLIEPLLEVGHSDRSVRIQLAALNALPAGVLVIDESLFQWLSQRIDPGFDSQLRSAIAGILSRAILTDAQRTTVAGLLPRFGPLDLTRVLPAFNRALPEPVARELLAGLGKAPALASCPPQALREIFAKQLPALQGECEALLARLNLDTAQQRAKLDAIAGELPAGEERRGQAVFAKTGCIVCHTMGYLGGKFGPDLTSIGNVRNERDLLEAIVFPSASFVRSYEPMTVHLKNGTELIGLLRGETSDSITLATAPGAEQRLARSEVEEMKPGAVSLMPQGFDQVLSRQDLSDLITFLKASQRKSH